MDQPTQLDPRLRYLLHFLQATIGYLGLVGVLTTALITIQPDIVNHIAWPYILLTLLSIIGFGALKGLINHIADPNLRAALLAVLEAIQSRIPLAEKDTQQVPTQRASREFYDGPGH